MRLRLLPQLLLAPAEVGGADDGGVGYLGELSDLAGLVDAEAYADGAVGEGFEVADALLQVRGEVGAFAGDSGDGEVVDEAGGEGGDFFAAVGGGGGGDEEGG